MYQRRPRWKLITEYYFGFTQMERRAFWLILWSTLVWLGYQAWWNWGYQANHFVSDSFDLARLEALQPYNREAADYKPRREGEGWYRATYPASRSANLINSTALHPARFDPNTITAAELLAMGWRQKAVDNLINYRSKGGRFRQPEDLRRLYGLSEKEKDLWVPYVRIETPAMVDIRPLPERISAPHEKSYHLNSADRAITTLDINKADSLGWVSLPGIGPSRARAILRFRDKLGGFASIEQVAETYALPDSVFQAIRHRLALSSGPFRLIKINQASAIELAGHPYIKKNVAEAIANFRQQHGPFTQPSDLLKIHIIHEELYEKISPYLSLD